MRGIIHSAIPTSLLLLPPLLLLSLPPAHHQPTTALFSPASGGPSPVHFFTVHECGTTKGCLFKPKGCTPHVNCTYALSYRSDSQRVYLELLGAVRTEYNSYVAVGLSSDGYMGNDTVTECSSFGGGNFVGRLSFNPGKTNRRLPLSEEAQAQMLTTHYAGYTNGLLYCRLSQRITPSYEHLVRSNYVRPLDWGYKILMASGPTKGADLTVHSINANGELFPMVSERAVHLTAYATAPKDFDFGAAGGGEPVGITGGAKATADSYLPDRNRTEFTVSPLDATTAPPNFRSPSVKTKATPVERSVDEATRLVLAKTHASLMLFAWMAFLSGGILSARFLRDHWPESRPMLNSPIWFLLHRGANLSGLALSSLSIVLIFYANGWAWHGPSFGVSRQGGVEKHNWTWRTTHCLVGLITYCLVLFQPFLALLNHCLPCAPRRFVLTIHGSSGFVSWLLATSTILIAVVIFGGTIFSEASLARDVFIAYIVLMLVGFAAMEALRMRKAKWRRTRGGLNKMMLTTTMVVPRGHSISGCENSLDLRPQHSDLSHSSTNHSNGDDRRSVVTKTNSAVAAEQSLQAKLALDLREANLLQLGILLTCVTLATVMASSITVMILADDEPLVHSHSIG